MRKVGLYALVFAMTASVALAQQAPEMPSVQQPAAASQTTATDVPAAAPASNAANPEWMQYKNPYSGEQNDVSNPHRTNEEIITWGGKAVSSVLSFESADFSGQIKEYKKYFTKEGWSGYAGYMQDSKLLEVARSGKYIVSTASTAPAVIVSSGAVNGYYQWRLRLPMMTTITTPDDINAQNASSSGRFDVLVTLSRTDDKARDGIALISWMTDDGQPKDSLLTK